MNKVTYEQRKAVYDAALRTYGADAQMMMAVEEMSELTKEICKIGRGKQDLRGLVDEIADVTIMMEQLCLIYGVGRRVDRRMDAKIQRLEGRIADHGGKIEEPIILSDVEKDVIRALADCEMKTKTAADNLHYHVNTIVYRCEQIKKRTGLNPRRFYDLVALLEIMEEAE